MREHSAKLFFAGLIFFCFIFNETLLYKFEFDDVPSIDGIMEVVPLVEKDIVCLEDSRTILTSQKI